MPNIDLDSSGLAEQHQGRIGTKFGFSEDFSVKTKVWFLRGLRLAHTVNRILTSGVISISRLQNTLQDLVKCSGNTLNGFFDTHTFEGEQTRHFMFVSISYDIDRLQQVYKTRLQGSSGWGASDNEKLFNYCSL